MCCYRLYIFEAYANGLILNCQGLINDVSEASKLSGFVARNLSGLIWSPLEVTDEADRDTTGDPEDAI
jgi:hypothetical protein